MKFFSLIKQENVHIASNEKVIPKEVFSELIEASEIVKKVHKDEITFRAEVAHECELLKEEAEKIGFKEGMKAWSEQLQQLEKEKERIRNDIEQALVPLALAAVKKIIGKELTIKPQTVVDIIATALKSVSQHRKITIYVHPTDLEYVESERPRLKNLFEHLESLSIISQENVKPGGCNIETEAGIIRAQLEDLLGALETAFKTFFQNHLHGNNL